MKSHLSRVGLDNDDWCLYNKKKIDTETETEGRMLDIYWKYSAASQRMPMIACNDQKPERSKEVSSS